MKMLPLGLHQNKSSSICQLNGIRLYLLSIDIRSIYIKSDKSTCYIDLRVQHVFYSFFDVLVRGTSNEECHAANDPVVAHVHVVVT